MPDIYQQIWDADQQYAGVKALYKGEVISADTHQTGYIILNKDVQDLSAGQNLIAEVVIPPKKQKVYDAVVALFDKYTLDERKPEHNFPEEQQEITDFIKMILDCPPVQVARDFLAAQITAQGGQPYTDDEWRTVIRRVWFEQFSQGNNPDLSAFEHVFVGEQKNGTLEGYHFWYKYYLDEHFRDPGAGDQRNLLNFLRLFKTDPPDVVTLGYRVQMFDYEARQYRPLTKPKGGFFVGPSPAGLIAMGLVRFLPVAAAPKEAIINGFKYNLSMFPSPNKRNMRTFYPEFIGPV